MTGASCDGGNQGGDSFPEGLPRREPGDTGNAMYASSA